jgi:phosphopantothenoylcysteine decarboxylase / phosphopantothenate---cysteine ligase
MARAVISAGGTREPIDPVRFVGNRSSGQMGYALAAVARDMGATVTLVSGPTALTPPTAVQTVQVETTNEMLEAVRAACGEADLLIMNAAVADFRPATQSNEKIKKKGESGLTLELVPNPDILRELLSFDTIFKVGFAAETNDLLENALGKLQRKGLHMIVANDATTSIGQPDIQLTILDQHGTKAMPRMPKSKAAAALMAEIAERYHNHANR